MDRQEITLNVVLTEETTALPTWKRALDLLLILLVAPALLLIGVAVALVIKIGSRGPIFFKQSRVGYKGLPFMLYKFRTMQANAETDTHRIYAQKLMNSETPMTKLDAKKDPRVIPLGGLLRATGIDELPQLLNVLRGEMSIVGPRPCLQYEYQLYDTWQRRRFDAIPGLTGLWQVSGKNRTTFNQMVRFDIEYAEKRSLLLDVSIIMRTIPALWQQCRDIRAHKAEVKNI
jgi:lipopolysaccharide/colanic/teichoic acid biosynthesis glycosyltransferase